MDEEKIMKGKLIIVAKTAGIKLESEGVETDWINPSKEAKKAIMPKIDDLKAKWSKEVEITLDSEKKYTSIMVLAEPEKKEVKKAYSELKVEKESVKDKKDVDVKEKKVDGEPYKMATQTGCDKSEEKQQHIKKLGKDFLLKEDIMTLQGKEFIKHSGLLDIAHKMGLKSIETEMITNEKEVKIFKATITMGDGSVFTGHGDADETNVNSVIKPHMIRIAETRAINRALRFATDIGICSYDEL